MKSYKNVLKNLLGSICAVGLLSLLLTSCVKKSNPTPQPASAFLSFVQASPDEPPLNFYFNGTMVNQSPLNYGNTVEYFGVMPGQNTVAFYDQGAMTPILSSTINLVANQAYSLILANVSSTPETLLLTDTLTRPSAGDASIRLVDLSPDAPAVDLVVLNGATLVSNRSFLGFSSFIPIPAKSNYTFELVQHGTSTVLVTLPSATLIGGYVYTLLFGGLSSAAAGSTDVLSATLVTNATF